MNGDDAIDALARRLRDAGTTAYTRAFLATVLTHCHRALNIHQRVRRAEATLAIDGRALFRTTEVAADVGRIERVYVEDYDLTEVHWSHLIQNDPEWYRVQADKPRTWARYGRSLLVVTPTPYEPIDVTVSYLIVPATITDAATPIDWPEELIPMLLDLAEGCALVKSRVLPAMDGAMSRFVGALGARPGTGLAWRKVNN